MREPVGESVAFFYCGYPSSPDNILRHRLGNEVIPSRGVTYDARSGFKPVPHYAQGQPA